MIGCTGNSVSAVFAYNKAYTAGGLYVRSSISGLFCSSFSNNSTRTSGGGLFIEGISLSNIITGIFYGNISGLVSGGSGGGLYLASSFATNNVVNGCLFVNNLSINPGGFSGNGGGAYFSAPSGILVNCVFSNNMASDFGGGLYVSGGISNIVSNCVFSGNSFTNASSSRGAGLCIYGNYFTIDGCVIRNHSGTNTLYGGGLFIYQSYHSRIINTIVSNNTAYNIGGGMFLDQNTGSNIISNCVISYNQLSNTGPTNYGAGVSISGSNHTVIYCTILSNIGPDSTSCGGGMFVNSTNSLIKWSHISNNVAQYGGGVFCSNYNEFYENDIADNNAYYGGGVYLRNGILMQYNNVSGNTLFSAGVGSGICAENAWGLLYINTVGSNWNSVYGNGIYIRNCALTNTQNFFINSGQNICFASNSIAGGLVFSGNWISGVNEYNTSPAIFEIVADTTNHTFIGNHFVTNRMGVLYVDFMTNHVFASNWSCINYTNYYGASTVYANSITTW